MKGGKETVADVGMMTFSVGALRSGVETALRSQYRGQVRGLEGFLFNICSSVFCSFVFRNIRSLRNAHGLLSTESGREDMCRERTGVVEN